MQDGRLVGAVTHVLINDPACGYGIFIENMLGAAEMPTEKASEIENAIFSDVFLSKKIAFLISLNEKYIR